MIYQIVYPLLSEDRWHKRDTFKLFKNQLKSNICYKKSFYPLLK